MASPRTSSDLAVSQETKDKIEKFEQADQAYRTRFEEFLERHAEELLQLDRAREERNTLLTDATEALRSDAQDADIAEVRTLKYGSFAASKKWSSYYLVDSFVQIAKDAGLYDTMLEVGVLREVTEINTKLAEHWLASENLASKFKPAEDGKELTPAITGPKKVPPFGSQVK